MPGIYLIKKGEKVLYVGQTNAPLITRLSDHVIDGHQVPNPHNYRTRYNVDFVESISEKGDNVYEMAAYIKENGANVLDYDGSDNVENCFGFGIENYELFSSIWKGKGKVVDCLDLAEVGLIYYYRHIGQADWNHEVGGNPQKGRMNYTLNNQEFGHYLREALIKSGCEKNIAKAIGLQIIKSNEKFSWKKTGGKTQKPEDGIEYFKGLCDIEWNVLTKCFPGHTEENKHIVDLDLSFLFNASDMLTEAITEVFTTKKPDVKKLSEQTLYNTIMKFLSIIFRNWKNELDKSIQNKIKTKKDEWSHSIHFNGDIYGPINLSYIDFDLIFNYENQAEKIEKSIQNAITKLSQNRNNTTITVEEEIPFNIKLVFTKIKDKIPEMPIFLNSPKGTNGFRNVKNELAIEMYNLYSALMDESISNFNEDFIWKEYFRNSPYLELHADENMSFILDGRDNGLEDKLVSRIVNLSEQQNKFNNRIIYAQFLSPNGFTLGTSKEGVDKYAYKMSANEYIEYIIKVTSEKRLDKLYW